jgi:hypothetical protein
VSKPQDYEELGRVARDYVLFYSSSNAEEWRQKQFKGERGLKNEQKHRI